ncbi:MAG TPA: hypothetical protein VHY37_08510 [Tepidisphaeraceae bacterium]|jgi:hypothetical protein|nr:hypothetical protein [Tepidisphaeraceae bacterium]
MNATAQNLCGYEVIEPLRDDCTYLVAGPGGRALVLKRLESDCLLRGGLHPSVRERLERVRELAHAGVANLHGVAREEIGGEGGAWLIWEYLFGEPIDVYAADPRRSSAEVRSLARELALTVDSLHQQGIVHGALVPGNLLVSDRGMIRLTHVSPLLFAEPAVDVASVFALLEHVLECRGESDGPVGRVLTEAKSAGLTLAMLASRLAAEPVATVQSPRADDRAAPPRAARRRALASALIVTVAALAGGAFLWQKLDPRPRPAPPIAPGTEITIRH